MAGKYPQTSKKDKDRKRASKENKSVYKNTALFNFFYLRTHVEHVN